MSKLKVQFVCNDCGGVTSKWNGKCPDCGAWNTLVETKFSQPVIANKRGGYSGITTNSVTLLAAVEAEVEARFSASNEEFDRVLGGGLVAGAVILMGGDPGVGKSTLLLQTACKLSASYSVLYVTGEESLQQVSLRADRLGLKQSQVKLLAATEIEAILQVATKGSPKILIIDSIQTMYSEALASAPGSVAQVRETAAQIVRFAKTTNTTVFLVGHVTKDGAIAGPRVLEHMVDTVLYFEGEKDNRFRVVRAVKNRFGAVNELGIFAMTEQGFKAVTNPSAMFVKRDGNIPGSVVIVSYEGSRPLLIEAQALVDDSHLPAPRRVAIGVDPNRLTLALAVLNRHGGVPTYNKDIYVNIVGGVRVTETAVDLGLILAITSSLKDKPLPLDLVVFGEVGLAGEIRPIQCGQERLKEAEKQGFKRAIIPAANYSKKTVSGMEVIAVKYLQQAIAII